MITHIIPIVLVNRTARQLLESLHHLNLPLFYTGHRLGSSHLGSQSFKTLDQWLKYVFFSVSPEWYPDMFYRLQ